MRSAALLFFCGSAVSFIAVACGDAYGEKKIDVVSNEPEPEDDASRGDDARILGSAIVPATDDGDASLDGDATTRTDALADGASCAPLKYDEALATILRGVIVGGGYHPITEHRVAGTPSSKAIVIANCGGASYVRCDALTFSTFAVDEYTSTTRRVDARDQRGHRFEFSLTYSDAGSCWSIDYARLDGANVAMLTQGYTSGQLNTCGATGEPTRSAASCPF